MSLRYQCTRLRRRGDGELVDEEALIAALTSGAIAGAGLDVFLNEPLPENLSLIHTPSPRD